jgi:hypothetical protein
MNLQAGANVGLAAAVGGLGGVVFGSIFASILDLKRPTDAMIGLGAIGGLIGAVAAGALVAPDATVATTTPTPTTGTAGPPPIASPAIAQLNR